MAAFKLLGTHTHTRTHTHTHTYFVLTHTRARANTQKYLILAKRRLQTHNSSHVVLTSSRMLTFALNYACPPKTCTAKLGHLPQALAECVYISSTFIAITLRTCTLPYMLHLPYAHNGPHTHTHVFAQKTQKSVLRWRDSLFIVDELDSSFRRTFSKVVKSRSMI